MAYSYPILGASNPEETPSVPQTVYDFWVITRIAHTVDSFREQEGGIVPLGRMSIRGRKYESVSGVINPLGDETTYALDDILATFSEYPELGDAYNVFVEAFGQLLEVSELIRILREENPDTFGQALINLRAAFQKLNTNGAEAKVTECIQNYPLTWDEETCLKYLSLWQKPAETPPPVGDPPIGEEV